MSARPDRFWRGPAPTLGQHTAEVLRERLGIDDAELARAWKPSTSSERRRSWGAEWRSRGEQFELEDVEDALVDGDVPYQRGTAQAALRHRDFRIVWFGTFASNIGTWMQNVVLGAYAWDLTHKGSYVGVLYFGQLGPLLFLSMSAACSPTSSTAAGSS